MKINVLSASCTSAAGLLEVIMGSSQQKPYNVSNAALSGYMAATFGRSLIAPDDILCGKRGFISNFCKEPNLNKLLGKGEMEILGGYFKPYAACRHCHAPIEAALKIYEKGIIKDDVKSIDVATYDLAVYGHDHKDIDSVNSAKMSTPFGVAVSILFGDAGMEMYTTSMIQDENIINMMTKITIKEDIEMSSLVPEKRAASVCVTLNNGSTYGVRVDYPLGEPENPVSIETIFAKFDSLLIATQYDRNYVANLHNFLLRINDKTSINEIINKF